jgi:hypothetical protein
MDGLKILCVLPLGIVMGGSPLGDCPFKEENPEYEMVLFLQDPTVEEADKTNVGWQNSIPLVKKTFLQS